MGRSHPYESERDACGIGFVADALGRDSRALVDTALEALCRVKHRGAVAADELTGDGAGLLLPLPRALLSSELEGGPERSDRLGVAMIFADPSGTGPARQIVAEACAEESLEIAGWRVVPTDDDALGERARAQRPAIEQAIVLRPLGTDTDEGERRAFRARRRIQRAALAQEVRLYVASFSFRTITYKGLVAADQLAHFYADLTDPRYETWFALFHQRFATNTTPTWERAQPFRFLAHNGEINTIRGNVAAMSAREGRLGSADLAPEDLLRPVVDIEGSDSAILDEALELLQRGGRDVQHAAAMLVPGAWEDVAHSDGDVRAFFGYHACLLEPWDGPAGLVFTDGIRVAAALDRNGLRPLRVSVCDDGLVACSSESGAVPTRGHGRVRRLKIGPGQAFCVDPSHGGVIEDQEIKKRLARRRPYGEWLREHLVEASAGTPVVAAGQDLTSRQVAAGFNKEEFTVVIRPMATEGAEPTSSMGDDTAQPPLAQWARPVFSFLKQRFAQVTNPPIDHLRERHVMSLSTRLGARHALLKEKPQTAKLRQYPSFLLWPDAVEELASLGAAMLDATFDVAEGPDGLEQALRRVAGEAASAVARGTEYVILSDRNSGPERAPVPSALGAGAVHHDLIRKGLRARASLVVDCDDPRETHHFAMLLTNGADAVCPRLTLQSIAELAKRGRLGGGVASDEAQRNYFHALEDGLLKVMSKMGISTLDSYRGAQIIEAIGLGPDVIDLCFDGVASMLGGLSLVELGADVWKRHELAYGTTDTYGEAQTKKATLPSPGLIKHRKGGDYHATNPDVVDALHDTVGLSDETETKDKDLEAAHALQRATKGEDASYERFARIVNERPPAEPRDLLEFVAPDETVPLEEVEPASAIAARFSTGAMSHGALERGGPRDSLGGSEHDRRHGEHG